MNDSKVSMTATLAWVAWGLAGLFLAAAWAASSDVHSTTDGMALCTLAIITAAAAATLHTRSFFCKFSRDLKTVYEYGKDVGRAEAGGSVPLQRAR